MTSTLITEPRLWRNNGWTARVIKNEEDEGWAVEMVMDGESEPALVGPWTMGRDKKNPKPHDAFALLDSREQFLFQNSWKNLKKVKIDIADHQSGRRNSSAIHAQALLSLSLNSAATRT